MFRNPDEFSPGLGTVLPSQMSRPHVSGPLAHLAIAVLESAIRDARGSRPRVRADALDWIESTDTGPFSVAWICDLLELDAGVVRAQLRAAVSCRRRGGIAYISQDHATAVIKAPG
jgi:hypothetical protein